MPLIESPQERPIYGGNTADDDSQVLDSLFQEIQEPPDKAASITDPEGPLPSPPRRPTRVLTGTVLVDPAYDKPTLLLPVDLNRTRFSIAVQPTADGGFINMADDPAKLELDPGAGRIYLTPIVDVLSGHTGAIWVAARNTVSAVQVSYWAVTA